MLRSAEKRARWFRNVTRNFASLSLVSRTSQEKMLQIGSIFGSYHIWTTMFYETWLTGTVKTYTWPVPLFSDRTLNKAEVIPQATIFRINYVNTMPADTLARWISRPSADVLLIM